MSPERPRALGGVCVPFPRRASGLSRQVHLGFWAAVLQGECHCPAALLAEIRQVLLALHPWSHPGGPESTGV